MIVGHGIDLQEIAAVATAYAKNHRFADKVLTKQELLTFESYSGNRKMEYLTGRWAAKEAFSKAYGSGIGRLRFQDLEVLNNEKGAPYFSLSPFMGQVFVSISHSAGFVQASVILEEKL